MRVVYGLIYACNLAHVVVALYRSSIQCLGVFNEVGELDSGDCVKVTDFRVHAKTATLYGVVFFICTFNHPFGAIAWNSKDKAFAFNVDSEILVAHSADWYDFGFCDVFIREYDSEMVLQVFSVKRILFSP